LKTILKHITSLYLIGFVLLSSIAVPYSAMTCLISDQTSWSILIEDQHCSDQSKKDSNSSESFEKSACCLFNNGIVDIDSELVLNDVKTFVSYIPTVVFFEYVKSIKVDSLQVKYTFLTHFQDQVPKRIAYQSFLC
jgi:hypothetical protein